MLLLLELAPSFDDSASFLLVSPFPRVLDPFLILLVLRKVHILSLKQTVP